jgi:hypothetical protein
VLLHAALSRPHVFSSLLLIDPVVQYANRYERWLPPDLSKPNPVVRRRNLFVGPAEMMDRFKDKTSYSSWQKEALADYCAYGLLPQNDQETSRTHYSALSESAGEGTRFCLACPPELEAATYAGSAETSEVFFFYVLLTLRTQI